MPVNVLQSAQMLELIEDIVRAEREADEAVIAAKEAAASTKRALEDRLQAKIADAREASKNDARRRIDEAKIRLDTKSQPNADAEKESDRFFEDHREAIDSLVDEIATFITATELDRS